MRHLHSLVVGEDAASRCRAEHRCEMGCRHSHGRGELGHSHRRVDVLVEVAQCPLDRTAVDGKHPVDRETREEVPGQARRFDEPRRRRSVLQRPYDVVEEPGDPLR